MDPEFNRGRLPRLAQEVMGAEVIDAVGARRTCDGQTGDLPPTPFVIGMGHEGWGRSPGDSKGEAGKLFSRAAGAASPAPRRAARDGPRGQCHGGQRPATSTPWPSLWD